VFGSLPEVGGFGTDEYASFIIPISLLQGAGFTGAATGVNLARDIEQGWFDRLLASPAPRPALLGGLVTSAAIRSLVPATVLLTVAFAIGAGWPGLLGLLIAALGVMATGTVAALWGCSLALRFRTQSAAPLMQAGMFVLVLFTTSYAPRAQLQPWLQTVSDINPVTQVVEMVRQGFVPGDVTWAETWPGLVALAGLVVVLGFFALRGMRRMSD
jgi:ABC-2 type transport system permease protein